MRHSSKRTCLANKKARLGAVQRDEAVHVGREGGPLRLHVLQDGRRALRFGRAEKDLHENKRFSVQ